MIALNRRNGLTLVEVMVASGLMAVLAAVMSATWSGLGRPAADILYQHRVVQEARLAAAALARDLGGTPSGPGSPIGRKEQGRFVGWMQPDRREAPTSLRGALPPAGRRMKARHAEERRREYFVDRFPALTLALIVTVALASLADGVLALHLLQNGCDEANPLMGLLLERGAAPFLVGKYLLTVLGLPLLLIYKNFYLFGTRIRVGHLLPIAVAVYFVLLVYQVRLLALCNLGAG